MNIDWTTIITSALTFVAGGGLTAVFTLKQARQSKSIDNAEKLVERYEAWSDKIRADADKNVAECKAEVDAAKKLSQSLIQKTNQLELQVGKMQKEIEMITLMYRNANAIRCENLNCKKRKPPLDRETFDNQSNKTGKT